MKLKDLNKTVTSLQELCTELSKRLKPCPICGGNRKALAVSYNSSRDDIIGWLQVCDNCDADTEQPILQLEEMDWKDNPFINT